MIEKHTFRRLIETVVYIEEGISKLEGALNCQFDQNWCTETPSRLITTIAEGFFENYILEKDKGHHSIVDSKLETIEELLYHFIYMEDCGNDSDHCKYKLVIVDEGSDTQESLSCTNLDELYEVICTYIERMDLDFTFNYCHSHKLDDSIETNK